ncbi:MAG: protein kinase [Woeseiaceae bacterium]|nr:protein kinase [Woeseiaceae bacterium]
MSADTKNVRDNFVDQLDSFDDQLHSTADDLDLLANVQSGIRGLLADTGSSEAQIRKVLQERYDAGALRKETFQLVKSMLDRFVMENIPTSAARERIPSVGTLVQPKPTLKPVPIDISPEGADPFGATTVIPSGFAPGKAGESRVQVGSLLRDRYLLQEKISGGSMGVVYKAMDRRLAEAGSEDHWVAIKVLSPQLAENGQALRALQQEAAKGRCLVHPNIVRFVDLDRDDDLYFLVMEWLEGRTLADILDSKDASTIDTKAAFRITRQIGEALEYAHSRGIVHADVKPGNIMIVPNGDAKLFDFGVARVRQQHADAQFDPGILGALTPAYSSMQVLTGENPIAADDVFSLSCLLYRLIAGYRVFGPRNAAEASQEGMKPQRLTDLNDSQWRALKKGLMYARVARFSAVSEFLNALNENPDAPFRVEETDRFADVQSRSAAPKWIVACILVVGLLAGAAYQRGYLNPLFDRYFNQESGTTSMIVSDPRGDSVSELVTVESVLSENAELTVADDVTIVPLEDKEEQPAVDTYGPDAVVVPLLVETARVDDSPIVGPDPMLVDFSTLPPPTEVISFTPGRAAGAAFNVSVREDGAPVIIDFVRGSGLATPMTLRLEEIGFSGNRSPWGTRQYALSDSGTIHFPAGQARGRVTLTMASDLLRESDQQSTLRLREVEFTDTGLAIVNVTLEDDDQRSFESRLPVNTIAFAVRQTSIREKDPAVQIDIVRFNPDNSSVSAGFSVIDITATEGKDYFAPGKKTVSFGPGQRSARLLVPLVQDSVFEGDETFAIEIGNSEDKSNRDIHRQIVVVIRDDDLQKP